MRIFDFHVMLFKHNIQCFILDPASAIFEPMEVTHSSIPFVHQTFITVTPSASLPYMDSWTRASGAYVLMLLIYTRVAYNFLCFIK